jgi:hypothetical protein
LYCLLKELAGRNCFFVGGRDAFAEHGPSVENSISLEPQIANDVGPSRNWELRLKLEYGRRNYFRFEFHSANATTCVAKECTMEAQNMRTGMFYEDEDDKTLSSMCWTKFVR